MSMNKNRICCSMKTTWADCGKVSRKLDISHTIGRPAVSRPWMFTAVPDPPSCIHSRPVSREINTQKGFALLSPGVSFHKTNDCEWNWTERLNAWGSFLHPLCSPPPRSLPYLNILNGHNGAGEVHVGVDFDDDGVHSVWEDILKVLEERTKGDQSFLKTSLGGWFEQKNARSSLSRRRIWSI